MSRNPRNYLGLIGLALTLGACSHAGSGQTDARHATSVSRYVAIARGKVDVAGGMIHVVAPRDGVIAELHGVPGSDVKADQILAVLDPRQSELDAAIAKAELEQATAHLSALNLKLPDLNKRAQRAAEAARAGAATQQSADDAKQALNELKAAIAEAKAGSDVATEKLKLARHEISIRTLHAPVDAHVVARTVHKGDVVSTQSGQALFTLLPDAPLIVNAELNEGFVDKVSTGMSAEVVADVGNTKVYKATVERIGRVFGRSKLVEDQAEASDTRDLECVLKLEQPGLRVGQRVQVKFLPKH